MRTGQRLEDRLARAATEGVIGRDREIELVARQLDADGAVLTFVHGIGGIGKSSLLAAIASRLLRSNAFVVRLDGRRIEPTPAGFLAAMGDALGAVFVDVDALATAVETESRPFVVMVDEYDRVRLLEPWLRHSLLPVLPERTRWIVAGRFAPSSAWLTTPGWSEAVLAVRLEPLDEAAAQRILARRGVASDVASSLIAIARGSPLALELAARRVSTHGLEALAEGAILDALAQRCVADLSALLREAVDAMSIVRRSTRPLLEAMLGRACDDDFLGELEVLPFVERTDDGLVLHDIVRQAVVARLRAIDPLRYRRLRASARSALETMLESSVPTGAQAWRLTADLLFIVEHPEIRDAFFPPRESDVTIDAALPGDRDAVLALIERHETPDLAEVFACWWEEAMGAFDVARSPSGAVVGITILAPSEQVPRAVVEADATVRAWLDDVAQGPGRDRGALFVRRALSLEAGEGRSEILAMQWLAAKRAYVGRPSQWAIYTATRDPAVMIPQMGRFGFRDAGIVVGDETTLRLELGARGIWSWLRRLVEDEAPSATDQPEAFHLDEASRGLVVDGRPVALSPLEYGVMGELLGARGAVITRDELLDRVWKQRHTGSNVVDALVRLLRKKLGRHAAALETVKGHGYRLRT